MVKKNWIKGAIKHPGSFKKAAEKAGKSTNEMIKSVLKPGSLASTKLKQQASLAKTLKKLRKGRK